MTSAPSMSPPEASPQGPGYPQGWYAEPGTGRQRWWDGTSWGPYAPPVAPAGSHPPLATVPERKRTGLIVLGWLGVLFLPLIGVIVGIVLCRRESERGHGIAQIVLSAL